MGGCPSRNPYSAEGVSNASNNDPCAKPSEGSRSVLPPPCSPIPQMLPEPGAPLPPLHPCPLRTTPCELTDETYALEKMVAPDLTKYKKPVREYLEGKRVQMAALSWRNLVSDILNEAHGCPNTDFPGVESLETCFPKPPPPPKQPEWKVKCARSVQNYTSLREDIGFDAFLPMGPGGDSCARKSPMEDENTSLLWRQTCKNRNELMRAKNALTIRYNDAAAEVEQLMKETVALRDILLNQRGCAMKRLFSPDKEEVHISEAMMMARESVSYNEWEIRQLDEILENVTFALAESKHRSQKVQDNFEIIKNAMPRIIGRIRDCRSARREAMEDMRRLIGEMGGMLDVCLRRPVTQWRQSRKILKFAFATFQNAMGDMTCNGEGEPPCFLVEFLLRSGFGYAEDSDALQKFSEDSTLMSFIHDVDMIFEFMTVLAKDSKDAGLTSLMFAEKKETYRPWSLDQIAPKLADVCCLLPQAEKTDETL